MRLYTSNSDVKIIGKICLYTLIIFLFYYGIVALVPKDLNGANQSQTNMLKAQDFVFEDKSYTRVFVGSSEAYRIPVNEISSSWANLGFAGGCSLTGLEVILRSKKHVDVVVVEVNQTLLRDIDDDLLQEITFWHGYPMGRQNTRLDYMINLGKNNVKRLVKKKELNDDGPIQEELARMQINMNAKLDEDKMRLIMTKVKRKIDILRNQGTRVILTETPNDPSLHDLQTLEETRRLVNEIFPETKYERYVVDWHEYKTKDGIHLTEVSAKKYAKKLVNDF